jgi:hypothetical protein
LKIRSLYRTLALGVLSNLSMSDTDTGEIEESKHAKLIVYLNQALLELHTRFCLSEKNLLIEMVEHITYYHLHRKYAETAGSNVPHPYIKDLAGEPFDEDVLKILSVCGNTGVYYSLNDIEDENSLFTPNYDTLQVPKPVQGYPLNITYQARHKLLDNRPNRILNQEFEVPSGLENALYNYIGHLVYSHMNGQENLVMSQNLLAAYEADCLRVENRDLVNQTFQTSHAKLDARGFV